MIAETLRIAWCPSCQRYIGEPHMSRVVLVYVAKKHLKDYGHGVFLEACGPLFANRAEAKRMFDPARRDEREEDRVRGG